MIGQSIRGRLTVWYLVVLAAATLTLAAGSVWLLRRSLVGAADAELAARVTSVRAFVDSATREMDRAEAIDEVQEYVRLSLGETLLEVTEIGGLTICRPDRPGWSSVQAAAQAAARSDEVVTRPADLIGYPMRFAVLDTAIHDRPYRIIAAISMRASDAALGRFQGWIAALAPLVLLLAGAGGYAISRRALAPLDAMTHAASAITLQHLDRRLEVPPRDDELHRLAVTFNAMLARLEAAVSEITRLTADASHELRTPVTLVRTTAEVALSQPRSADDYRQALAEVQTHAEAMSTLVDDLLVLARLDSSATRGDTEPIDVRAVVDDAVRRISGAADRRGLVIARHPSAGPSFVAGPAEALRRLLLIALDNAVKYTDAGGRIDIRLEPVVSPAQVVVSIIDTGIGLDAEDEDRIFDRFYRGIRARAHSADGAGLGLAIARVIVGRQGGAITVQRGPGGVGCAVRITLPEAG